MNSAGLSRMSLWLYAVRDGFLSLLPMTFFKVLAQLIDTLPWPAYQHWMQATFSGHHHVFLSKIIFAVDYTYGVALAVLVSVHLMRKLQPEDEDEIPVTVTGLAAFANFMIVALNGNFSAESLSFKAIFLGAAIGILSAEFLRKLAFMRIFNVLRMPYEADMQFYYVMWLSPAVMLMGALTLFISQGLVGVPSVLDINIMPMIQWMEQQPGAIWMFSSLAITLNQFFWSIGFHGWLVITGYFNMLILPPDVAYDGIHVFRPLFTNFLLIGGSGATLGLLVAIFLVAKRGFQRKIGYISIIPGLFNINDTLLYGLPIILNPRYLIPFIGVPFLLNILVLVALQTGFIVPLNVNLPWTTPVFISGWLLTGSWHGVALQLMEVVISTLIYMPFVKRVEVIRQREEKAVFEVATQAILNNKEAPVPTCYRQDQIGMIARGLYVDLMHDLQRHTLFLVYQPKHHPNGAMVGVEALLRWPHHQHGQIPPQIAVTLAEEKHRIHALGDWIIREACAFKQRLNTIGFSKINMAINISPMQLLDPALVKAITHCLADFHLSPDEIELEITESSILPDHPVINETLMQLSVMGVRLAIDDFGMGYTSLRYLNRFKVSTLKIDGSLTKDVLTNEVKADIIRSIIALGISRQLEVVAEYVETQEQKEMLTSMGCSTLQGYLFSCPLTQEDCLHYVMRTSLD